MNNEKINWRTVATYIDVTTGEILTRDKALTEYIIINKKIKRYVTKMVGKVEITNECKPNPQKRLAIDW